MKYLGISGKLQSGKDTIAEAIINYCKENNIQNVGRHNFADSLYEEIAIAITSLPVHLMIHERNDRIEKAILHIKRNKKNFRRILQGWGTDFRRELCGKDYWINKWIEHSKEYPPNKIIIVSDVRFLNEFKTIRDHGGVNWRVMRPPYYEDSHISETELDGLADGSWSAKIDNSGTKEQLEETAVRLFKEQFLQL